MKKILNILIAVIAFGTFQVTSVNAAVNTFGTFTLASSAPKYPQAMQNIMAVVESRSSGSLVRNLPETACIRRHSMDNGIWTGYFRPGDAVTSTSSSFPIWDGTNSPQGDFSGQFGSRLLFPVHIESVEAFFPQQVTFVMESSDFYHAFAYSGNISTNTANGNLVSWSETLVGKWWGPDGIKDTSDDVTYTSGACVNLVNEIFYAGIRNGFTCSDQTSLDFAKNYFSGQYPMEVTTTYTLWKNSANSGEILASGSSRLTPKPILLATRGTSVGIEVNGQTDRLYDLQSATNTVRPIRWSLEASSLRDGTNFIVNTSLPMRIFRVRDAGVAPSGLRSAGGAVGKPAMSPSND
ncbi:MAG: hypothetical protein Q7R78_01265 [bacterium]|nr:hypothetical protein [bacterium]